MRKMIVAVLVVAAMFTSSPAEAVTETVYGSAIDCPAGQTVVVVAKAKTHVWATHYIDSGSIFYVPVGGISYVQKFHGAKSISPYNRWRTTVISYTPYNAIGRPGYTATMTWWESLYLSQTVYGYCR